MDSDLLRLAARLLDQETPYAIATVVRRERPSSAASGNTAVITVDGTVHGWIGGSCTLPEVTRHAIASLAERQPRLLAFGGAAKPRSDVISVPMSCGSEGKVEVHINPVYPAPRLVVVGASPIADAVARLGEAMGYRVVVADGADAAAATEAGEGPVGERVGILDGQFASGYASRPRGAALYAVVATMGRGDEDAVEQLLAARADYLGVVVSPKRMGQVREYLAARGVCGSRIEKVRGPAGLDIGAVRPEEVAISILAETVALARAGSGVGESVAEGPDGWHSGAVEGAAAEGAATPAGATATATDPVCGMTVPADGSRPSSTYQGQTVHFCCPGCRARFEADPAAYV
ncbi:MAG: YHS domain-containing protein [Gemmatimonadetes bacterium]|nr:YHS domain-containing protein [Gemmatimonadota bacterium]MYI45175.1 YHS domain-containing protein [Gemmatimonadota bacterium]